MHISLCSLVSVCWQDKAWTSRHGSALVEMVMASVNKNFWSAVQSSKKQVHLITIVWMLLSQLCGAVGHSGFFCQCGLYATSCIGYNGGLVSE